MNEIDDLNILCAYSLCVLSSKLRFSFCYCTQLLLLSVKSLSSLFKIFLQTSRLLQVIWIPGIQVVLRRIQRRSPLSQLAILPNSIATI